jgi:hypothetical protein
LTVTPDLTGHAAAATDAAGGTSSHPPILTGSPAAPAAKQATGTAGVTAGVVGDRAGPTAQQITSTSGHLYLDITTGAWTEAGQLKAGDRLQQPNGTSAVVTATVSWTTAATTPVTYNLTIADQHTYYVTTGGTPVLVHNCSLPKGGVYALTTEDGTVVRTGMAKNLAARAAQHAKKYPDLTFNVLYRSDARGVRRGLEEMVEGWFSPILANQRAIRFSNPRRAGY